MDSECLSLLPSICEVLSDPKLLLPDDTSLEKLLDWFKEELSQNGGQHLMQHQPCLLQFLCKVSQSDVIDPSVFTFSLKLAGLLAAKEQSFSLLEDGGVLGCLFEPDHWRMSDLWKNASVRCGWLQGLWNMLQHQQAIDFFCRNGLIKLVLHLQIDESLFISSFTSQILVHILNSITLSAVSSNADSVQPGTNSNITTEVMTHVAESLASGKQDVTLSGLRLLAEALTHIRDSLKEMLWKRVVKPLEVLVTTKGDSLTRPIMTVLQAAARTHLFAQPECGVEALMQVMLYSSNTCMSVQCAALILQLQDCPEGLKRKATEVILLPLRCVITLPLHPHNGDELNGHDSHLEDELSQRVSCLSLLTQSLSSMAELIRQKSLDTVDIQLVTSSLVSLLRMCLGHRPSASVHRTNVHLIGCCKVQRCALDALGSTTVYKESVDFNEEIFTVLLQYLQCPDTHATVLKKAHEAILKWFSVCTASPELWKTVSLDLFPLLKKHACDGRWEVRDSTLEFIAQLTTMFKDDKMYIEAFHSNDMFSVLFTSLSDVESYVQASAVLALGRAVTTTDLQLSASLQEKAATHLLSVLAKDSESFPRRAAVKVFTSWLKGPCSLTAVDQVLNSVLSLGCSDFDWEVKVHTLELADVLLEKWLNPCNSEASEKTCWKQVQNTLMDLGLFSLLLKCLFDCDRPVCQKACALLLKLRAFTMETSNTQSDDLVLEICKNSWGEDILRRCQERELHSEANSAGNGDEELWREVNRTDSDLDEPKAMSLCKILEVLDLEEMQHTLSLSSDHVINSPRSLMEDILSMAQQREENVIDCY